MYERPGTVGGDGWLGGKHKVRQNCTCTKKFELDGTETMRTFLVLCCLSAVASLVPAARPVSTRRSALAAAAAAVVGVTVRPATADVAVPPAKVGVTPGGVKFFEKVSADTCSPFNPCTPQVGDIVKIKYKSFLSNGQMYDSSEGPGRKPLAVKFGQKPPAMIPGWEEAIDGMKMGQTRIIQVPANMAYGDKGSAACSKATARQRRACPRLQFFAAQFSTALGGFVRACVRQLA